MKQPKNMSPPRLAVLLLKRLERYRLNHAILEDMRETFTRIVREKGLLRARLWYWGQCFDALLKNASFDFRWSFAMLKNYLKIAWRNLSKHKSFSAINIFGLALGMACCILILLWVRDELSFDTFHENADRIFRVTIKTTDSKGEVDRDAITSWPLGPALKQDYPEIIEMARLRRLGTFVRYGDKRFMEREILAVDPGFLKMFSFPLIDGDSTTALQEPNTILLTEKTAKRYFGSEDPLGKTVTLYNRHEFKITGILKNVPLNSSLRIDFLVPFDSTLRTLGWAVEWHTQNYITFIQLGSSVSLPEISGKIYDYKKRKVYTETSIRYELQSITDMHLRSNYSIDIYGRSEYRAVYVYVFLITAIFILLIACINFMNLSTARSWKRAKEVGLRKVVGARRTDIIRQFYGESIFFTFLSQVIGISLVAFLLPSFNSLSGKQLRLEFLTEPMLLLGILGITLLTGLIAGSYPALVQSSFRSIDLVKSRSGSMGRKSNSVVFRRILVVFQFAISVILISGTLVVYNQLDYVLSKDLGYDKEGIVCFTNRTDRGQQYEAFKNDLLKIPNVVNVTASSDIPTYTVHSTTYFEWEGKDPDYSFSIYQFAVDFEYIETFGMEIKDGRAFSREYSIDETGRSYIVNETAVRAMGLENPVGKGFTLWGNKGTIVGVVKDFNYKSLQTGIEPLVLRVDHRRNSTIFAKLKAENLDQTMTSITDLYNRFIPEYPFTFRFLDEALEGLYQSERRTQHIFLCFTVMAILISCLGLFGLAAFLAQQKTKEIGVRKVLGASIPNIVTLISREFFVLVSVANIIAWPAAYYLMNKWLGNFAYRINVEFSLLILAGIVSLAIALITVSFQSIKAGTSDPVDSLRYE